MRIRLLPQGVSNLGTRISNKFVLPERFKGTVVEKWANYWRGLASDYVEVVKDVAKEVKTKPKKSALIASSAYGLYACSNLNPDEEGFMRSLRSFSNQMIMIPKTLQNPVSSEYLRELEQVLNQNRLRTLSLGVCTLLWVDRFDKDDCTYPATCEYTRVNYMEFFNRILDIGFCNRYWRLEWKMRNFDVNYL